MTVQELNSDQITELKANYIYEVYDETVPAIDFVVDEYCTNEEIFDYYSDYIFSVDDFGCTAGRYDLEE